MKTLAILVDFQVDFITGSLPVPGGHEAMMSTIQYLTKNRPDRIVLTQDRHLPRHISFASTHGLPIGTVKE